MCGIILNQKIYTQYCFRFQRFAIRRNKLVEIYVYTAKSTFCLVYKKVVLLPLPRL